MEVAARCRRRPPRHVGMRWCRGSRSVSASSTHARSLDLRFVALVGVAAVGTCWCSRERGVEVAALCRRRRLPLSEI